MRQPEFWLPSEAHLAEAIAYAKRLAISEMTEAGIDIVTDGEIGRESYSNHFLCSLDGIYFKEPAEIRGRRRRILKVPRIVVSSPHRVVRFDC